ncbi:vicilin-like seed storage protein At2g18540 [Benincasa hispida]|uniref:vicilin-like seed storage protein At2g18540 n=1 Tax=Benincasa hispida TaxID=102211 RepID=UPI00190288AB|nr:vicilin-like seed storage protein At2g18540 [Benincasa hispida]
MNEKETSSVSSQDYLQLEKASVAESDEVHQREVFSKMELEAYLGTTNHVSSSYQGFSSWKTLSDGELTLQVRTGEEGPSKGTLEEVVAERQPEVAEEKKKKKIKEKRAKEDEEAHPIKKKERSERKERMREEKRLKKEKERRKRAVSPELDGESTSIREDKGESAQLRESTQPETTKTIVINEGEEGDVTPLMWCRKENAPQGSKIDPTILQVALEEQERRRKEEDEKKKKSMRAKLIIVEGSRKRRLHDEKVRRNNEISAEEERRRLEEEQRLIAV